MDYVNILYVEKESKRIISLLREYGLLKKTKVIFVDDEKFIARRRLPMLIIFNGEIIEGYSNIRKYVRERKKKEVINAIFSLIKKAKGNIVCIDSKKVIKELGWSDTIFNKKIVLDILRELSETNQLKIIRTKKTKKNRLRFVVVKT